MSEICKKKDLKKVIQSVFGSDYRDDLCEHFTTVLLDMMKEHQEDKSKDWIGYFILKSVQENNMDNLFISLCGWTFDDILKKCNLICDDDLIFHDEICEASFVSVWDGGTIVETPCKVNMTTHEVFEIVSSESSADQVNVLDREFIVVDGNEYPVFPHDEAEEYKFGAFWYGEDE